MLPIHRDTLSIRPAVPADLMALAALERAAFPEDPLPPLALRQWIDLFGPGLLLAEARDGSPVGYLAGGPGLPREAGREWILAVAVAPAARGAGVARELLAAWLEGARSRGAREVRATVAPKNQPSLALFRRAGFRAAERELDYFGPGATRDLLVLALVPPGEERVQPRP